jgi:hypothetical protein
VQPLITKMFPHFTVLLLPAASSALLRVFDFSGARSAGPGAEPSSALLSRGPEVRPLPARFIICSSTRQGKLDGKSPFLLQGADGAPWLAFSFWSINSYEELWADVQKGGWMRLLPIGEPLANAWMQVCADVDTESGNMTVSLNGRPAVTVHSSKLRTNRPEQLDGRLQLGLTNTEAIVGGVKQYFGSVTNINMYRPDPTMSTARLAGELCASPGDLLAWPEAAFQLAGTGVRQEEVSEESVCGGRPHTYRVLLPAEVKSTEARHSCQALGDGRISGIGSVEEMEAMAAWVRQTNEQCKGLWTPTSDQAEEGVYRSAYSGDLEPFLPWRHSQPNGGLAENFVAMTLEQENPGFYDLSNDWKLCAPCTLTVTTTIRLRGMCLKSYLGE